MTIYTNIHSHFKNPQEQYHIHSIYNGFDDLPSGELISVGIHPWYIKEDRLETELKLIRSHASDHNVLAIGECGLDKLVDTPMELQEYVFKEQLKIAESAGKPMIIHCVKAFDELVRIKKEMDIKVPLLVHGYNNNEQIAGQLLKNGFYISFGKALMNENSNASKIISKIPLDKLFLETDDADITIQSIFEAAADRLKMDLDKLKEQVFYNFKTVFKYE